MNDITSPLRLSAGSHQAGSGQGCAMNVISWESGDTTITDYPACAARPLARMVQLVNDSFCTHRDEDTLCPPCSIEVLALAHRTVGTSSWSPEQEAEWFSELLDSDWGVIRFTSDPEVQHAIRKVAALYSRKANGQHVGINEWGAAYFASAASSAASSAAYAAYAASFASAAYSAASSAADAAYASSAAYAASFANAASSASSAADARMAFAHQAIDAWERITDTKSPTPTAESTKSAVQKMLAVR